jgi:uncharacterized membrane protein/predicted transcriptional regulator
VRFGRTKGGKGPVALALLLVLFLGPLFTASGSEPSRATVFQVAGVLDATQNYDPHTGNYSGLFPMLVSNTGDTVGDGTLTVTGLPTGWTWTFVEGQGILASVPPGSVIRTTVHIEAWAPPPGDYPFQVRIDPGPAIVPFTAKVPFLGALELACTPTAEGGVSFLASVNVTVTNLANGPDSFNIVVFLPSTDWSYDTNGPLTSPVLGISGRYTWSFSIRVPYSAEATTNGRPGHRAWFKVVSRTDPGTMAMNSTNITVLQHRAIYLSFKDTSYTQDTPGSVVTLKAILENGGNAPEKATLTAQVPAGWTCQKSSTAVRDLEQFERITVALYVMPGPDASSGRYSVSFKVTTAGTPLTASTSASVVIPDLSGLSLTGASQYGPDPLPGGDVKVDFTLRNGGNHVELVELSATDVPSGWAISVSPSLVSLPPWGRTQAQATVHVSGDPLGSLSGTHGFGLAARSLFTRANATLVAHVDVAATAGLQLYPEVPIWAFDPMVDPEPVYIFRLRNTGNVQVTADLRYTSLEGQVGWLQPSRAAITVAPGDIGSFTADVVAPRDAMPGDYGFSVIATTKEAGGATAVASIGLTVLEADVMVASFQGRGPGGPGWSSGPSITTGQELEAVVWLRDLGTDPLNTVQLSIFVDGKFLSTRNVTAPRMGSSAVWGVAFKLHPGQGSHNISVRASAPGERNTEDNEASMRIYVAPVPLPVKETAAVAGTAFTATALLVAVILVNEGWKFKALLLFVVPLYTRIRPEATLDNFTRGRIYGYVEANPGEHYNAIKKALALPNGSLAHHLDMLIREGYVRFEADGNYKRFYPSRMRLPADGRLQASRPTRIQEIILEAVREVPGISQREISRTLNLSPSTINYHIRVMATNGLLRLERGLGRTRCHLGDRAPPEGTDPDVSVEEGPEP